MNIEPLTDMQQKMLAEMLYTFLDLNKGFSPEAEAEFSALWKKLNPLIKGQQNV